MAMPMVMMTAVAMIVAGMVVIMFVMLVLMGVMHGSTSTSGWAFCQGQSEPDLFANCP